MKALLVALCLLLPLTAAALDSYRFDSAEQEALYCKLTAELRCLVCQNETLADSSAGLARDLRQKTYAMVRAGRSEREVIDFMVGRYGDFVLYRPPLRSSTLLLWLGPVLFVIGGMFSAWRLLSRPARLPERSPEQLARARRLLEEDEER